MITIDAMKLSNNKNLTFCFITNDSDFCTISMELRQMGIETILLSTKEDKSIECYFDNTILVQSKKKEKKIEVKAKPDLNLAKDLQNYIKTVYGSAKKDEDKWASYSSICASIKKKYGEIDYKNIGYKNRKEYFIKNGFEIEKTNYRRKK